jgi:hypothetical protein
VQVAPCTSSFHARSAVLEQSKNEEKLHIVWLGQRPLPRTLMRLTALSASFLANTFRVRTNDFQRNVNVRRFGC